jgi:MFS family permease
LVDDKPARVSAEVTLTSAAEISEPKAPFAVVEWDGPNDPANPKNWTLGLRIYHTLLPALYGFSVSIGTSVYAPAVFDVEAKFNVSQSVALLGLTLFALGLALGPVLGAPISETRGRKAVYLVTLPLFMLFTVGAGLAQSIQIFIIWGFLSSTVGLPALAVGAGTIADVWDMEHGGGLATVLITSTFFIGPSLGPLIGGYTMQIHQDWRWIQWVMLMIAGPVGVAALPARETSKKIILSKRAKARGEPGPPQPPLMPMLKQLLVVTLVRPLHMLVAEPIVTAWALYHSFAFGVLFAFFDSYPYVFIRTYGFTFGQVGLAFLGIAIGTVLAVLTFFVIDKTIYRKIKLEAAPGRPAPEERLYTSILGAFGIPIALFWFAWTARMDVHFMVPIAAGIPFGWGIVTLFVSSISLLAVLTICLRGHTSWLSRQLTDHIHKPPSRATSTSHIYKSLSLVTSRVHKSPPQMLDHY